MARGNQRENDRANALKKMKNQKVGLTLSPPKIGLSR